MNTKINYGSVDIGGTNVRFALVENNKIVYLQKFKVDQDSPYKTLAPIIELINEHKINVLGVACPGPADYETGFIINPPNLKGWHNFDLKNYILTQTKVEHIFFENDANVAAFAAHKTFNQTHKDITQFFTVSTGLGAGLVHKDEIFVGCNHVAQEVAMAPLAPFETEEVWNLGPYALELFASGSGMEKRAHTLGLKNVSTQFLFAHYNSNPVAKQVIDQAIKTLANLFATSLAFTAPNLIVVGGSVATHNKWFVQEAWKNAEQMAWPNQYKKCRLEFDHLGDDNVLLGLDYLARHKFN